MGSKITGDKIVADAITYTYLEFSDSDGNIILRVDDEGFDYKGKRIEDAGEAYQAFIDACNRTRCSV